MKYLVASGRLASGDELPPIRTLAEQLLVNPNTVARAYRELEAAGVVVTRHGAGTHVSGAASPLARRERLDILSQRIDALLAEARQMNFGAGRSPGPDPATGRTMRPRAGGGGNAMTTDGSPSG